MNKNEIKILKQQNILGKEFVVYGDVLEPLFLAKDVAEMIDYDISNVSKMVKNVDDDEKIIARTNNTSATFLTEDGLYEVLMQSRKPIAKAFKKEVKEILKQLRRTGAVITEAATDESIDYQTKYGKYRIRRTFNESSNLRATYEEFAALSKIECAAKRIDNKDRIRSCKAIINVLEEKIANEVLTLRPSELIAIQELINDIQYDITKLSNKLNGGKKSAMTKKISQLKDELNMATNDYYEIPKHGFSVNYMYSYDEPNRKVCKSRAYQSWISKLNLNEYLPVELPNVSLEEPLRVSLCYICKESFDVENMNKSILDEVANYYNFNDNIISEVRSKRVGICDEYYDGKIYIKIENIEGYDDNE